MLGILLACVAGIAGAWASQGPAGSAAYAASATAAALIWATGSIGLLICAVPRTAAGRTNGAMLAILVRTLAPVVMLVAFDQFDNKLTRAGVAGMILVHYFVGLVAETYFTIRLIRATGGDAPSAPGPHPTTAGQSPAY